jgi:8-oxo-dGTP diphosphatase
VNLKVLTIIKKENTMQKFPFVAALFIENNKVLLLLRQNTGVFDGFYALPGGRVDEGESLRAAMIREIYEEVGVKVKEEDAQFIHLLSFKNEFGNESAAICFLIKKWQGELINKEPERHGEIKWFPIDDLPENISPRTRHDIEMVTKGLLYSEHGWHE